MPTRLCAGPICGEAPPGGGMHTRVCVSARSCSRSTSHLVYVNLGPAASRVASHNAGSYSNSMAQLACSQSRKSQSWGQGQQGNTGRRGSFASIPPPSLSHQKALQLEQQEKAGQAREAAATHHHHLNEKLHDLVDAIRHLRSHSSQCVRMSTSSLHIGECPEVPEHTATFALKRTGMLKWQEAAGEDEEEEKEKEMKDSESVVKEKKSLGIGKNHSAPNLLRKSTPQSAESTRPTRSHVKDCDGDAAAQAESVASNAPSLASTSSYLSGLAALSNVDSDASAPSPRKSETAGWSDEFRRVDANSPTALSASSLAPTFRAKKSFSWNKLKERLRQRK